MEIKTEFPKLPPPVLKIFNDDVTGKKVVFGDTRVMFDNALLIPLLGHELMEKEIDVMMIYLSPSKDLSISKAADYIGDISLRARCKFGNVPETNCAFLKYMADRHKFALRNNKPIVFKVMENVPEEESHEFYREQKLNHLVEVIRHWYGYSTYAPDPPIITAIDDMYTSESEDETLDLY